MGNRKSVFTDIRVLTDAACRAAYTKRTLAVFKNEPVNWANLSCTTVEWYEADTGNSGYRVRVSEAADRSEKLAAFITNYLSERGHVNVDVVTEW